MDTSVQSAYNSWAEIYDDMENKTRDLDKQAMQLMLGKIIQTCHSVLEIGCGTGKNTAWLVKNAKKLTAIDFSDEMLSKAKQKMEGNAINFQRADIAKKWPFENHSFQLITCNLVLEHISDLDFVFSEASRVLETNGYFFISELHPCKQYNGSKARFELNNESISPHCFIHHTSDYFTAALSKSFSCIELKEWFYENDRSAIPRLINFIFRKAGKNS